MSDQAREVRGHKQATTPKTVVGTLKAAKKLIEKGWTQGEYARDARDNPIPNDEVTTSKKAAKFCSWGALMRVDGPFEHDARGILGGVMNANILDYNDSHTKRSVLAAFNKAIKLAGGK